MKRTIFTICLGFFVAFSAISQSGLNGTKTSVNNGLFGSRTNNQISNHGTPKPSQTGSKVLALNEGFIDTTTLTPSGWNRQNLSSPIGTTSWFPGAATTFSAYEGAAGEYIAVNYNSTAGTGTISNWLITPVLNLKNGDVFSFWTRGTGGTYPDRLQVRMSLNGTSTNVGATATSVGDFNNLLLDINPTYVAANYPAVWTLYSVTISGVTGTVPGKIAFRYFVENGGPTGANSDYIGIDLVQYDSPVAGTFDVSMVADASEYTIMPVSQSGSITPSGTIANVGPTAATNALMTVDINDGMTNVWTGTSTAIPGLAVSANQNVSTNTAWTSTVGDYTFTHTASITETDINLLNNVDVTTLSISDSVLARDNGLADDGTLGIGDGTGGALGTLFTVNNADQITSVSFYLGSNALNLLGTETMDVIIYDFNGTAPVNLLYQSPTYSVIAPDTMAGWRTVVLATPLSVTPGTYFVGLLEYAENIKLARSVENYTPQTSWLYFTGTPWTTTDAFAAQFNGNYLLRPNFGIVTPVSINEYNNKPVSVYPNPSNGTVFVKNASSKKLVVSNVVGEQVYNTTINSDIYEINLNSFAKGMYFVQVESNVYKIVVE